MDLEVGKDIADALLDLPPKDLHPYCADVVIVNCNIELLPTGSIVTSYDVEGFIAYHSNDVHAHGGILVWCSYDGTDRISLQYEPGRTRPMILELDSIINSHPFTATLSEFGHIVRGKEYAHKPNERFLSHPRYLQTISHLVQVLPLTHLRNDGMSGFLHKWQPSIWHEPTARGYTDVRTYYRELELKENSLASALRLPKLICSTCVDFVILFISLLHEELFIKVTSQEQSRGIVPVTEKFLSNTDDYDLSRLLRPSSEIYKFYEEESQPYLIGLRTHGTPSKCRVFFFPFVLGVIIIGLIALSVKFYSYTASLNDSLIASLSRLKLS